MRRAVGVVAAITWRFIRSASRDRVALVLAFVVPVVVSAAMGFADQYANSSLAIGIVTPPDAGPLAGQLVETFEGASALSVERYASTADLERAVRTGAVVAGVDIGTDFDEGVLAQGPGPVRVFGQDNSSASTAAQADTLLLVASYETLVTYAKDRVEPGESVSQAVERLRRSADSEIPVVRVVSEKGSAAGGLGRYTAGMLIFYVFVSAVFFHGAALRDDRRRGVVARMGVTPNPSWTIVGGELAGRALLSTLQATVVLGFGAVVFGFDWGDPLAVFAIVALFVLTAISAGMLVGVAGRPLTAAEAQMRMAGLVTAAGLLGGCFWPLALGPAWLETVAHVSPHAWANDAFNEVLATDAGVAQVWLPLAVLGMFAGALFTSAYMLFRRRVYR